MLCIVKVKHLFWNSKLTEIYLYADAEWYTNEASRFSGYTIENIIFVDEMHV